MRQVTTQFGAQVVVYFDFRQFNKSIPLFEELLKVQTARFGKDHPETFRTVANLAVNYKNSGRPADALPLFEEAHRGVKKHPELKQYPQFRNAGRTLLESYAQSNNRIAASNLLIDVLPDARIQLPKDSPQLAGMLAQICLGLLDQKKWAEAEPLLRECLAIREKTQPDVWSTFNTQSQLGGALLGQKKYADAEPLLLAGYEGMKQRESTLPEQGKSRLPEAVERLIDLYTDTDKPDDVQKWQVERAKYPLPAASAREEK